MLRTEERELILKWCKFKPIIKVGEDPHSGNRSEYKVWTASDNSILRDLMQYLDLNFYTKYAIPILFEKGLDYKQFSDDRYHFVTFYTNDRKRKDVASSIAGELEPTEAWESALIMLIKETKYGK